MQNTTFLTTGVSNSPISASVQLQNNRKVVTVSLSGLFVSKDIDALRDFLQDVLKMKPHRMMLDLSELETLSYKGMGVLSRFSRLARQRGVKLIIDGLRPEVRASLKEFGFYPFLTWVVQQEKKETSHIAVDETGHLTRPLFP